MDRLASYRAALDAIVRRFGAAFQAAPDQTIETVLITDPEHGQYGVWSVGWQPDGRRSFGPLFMARIKDGKVWVEADNTDLTLADELLAAGVPREHIVLAFHPPERRRYSDFAAA